MPELTIGFSPCPNDTFIFDALVNDKLDTGAFTFNPVLADVEELNQMAFEQKLDITKLSYHAFAYAAEHYTLLNAGSALGNNCGPLLISKRSLQLEDIDDKTIAIPGRYTTANFLLSIAAPSATNKVSMLFSTIEEAVLSEQVDAGLIIHENRFTYQDKGLRKVADLGEFWEDTTSLPIPLGGIAMRRDLDLKMQRSVDRLLKASVEHALSDPRSAEAYVKKHAQEMNRSVMYKHIDLYVNNYSVDLGRKGRTAVRKLFDLAQEKEVIPHIDHPLFVRSSSSKFQVG